MQRAGSSRSPVPGETSIDSMIRLDPLNAHAPLVRARHCGGPGPGAARFLREGAATPRRALRRRSTSGSSSLAQRQLQLEIVVEREVDGGRGRAAGRGADRSRAASCSGRASRAGSSPRHGAGGSSASSELLGGQPPGSGRFAPARAGGRAPSPTARSTWQTSGSSSAVEASERIEPAGAPRVRLGLFLAETVGATTREFASAFRRAARAL